MLLRALLLLLLVVLLLLLLLLLLPVLLLLAVYTQCATGTTVASVAARVASTEIADDQTPFCLPTILVMQIEGSLRQELPIFPFNFACSWHKPSQDSSFVIRFTKVNRRMKKPGT